MTVSDWLFGIMVRSGGFCRCSTVAMTVIGCLVSGLAVGAFVGELVSASTVLDCDSGWLVVC